LLYRPGAISAEMLSQFAPVVKTESPAAPGHLKHHYMPRVPLVVLSHLKHFDENAYQELCWRLECEALHPGVMTLSDNPTLAARELYAEMRQAETHKNVNCIIVAYDFAARTSGLWASISDRLQRAARLIL